MEQEEVLIHGVSYNAMCQILHFIYTSELELSLSNVQETLVAACQLQVRLPSLQQGRPKPRGVLQVSAGQWYEEDQQAKMPGSKRDYRSGRGSWVAHGSASSGR